MMIELVGIIGGIISVLLAFLIILSHARIQKRLAENIAITRFGYKKSTISYYDTKDFFKNNPLNFYVCSALLFLTAYFIIFLTIMRDPYSKHAITLLILGIVSNYLFIKRLLK